MTDVIQRSKLADFLSTTVPQFSGDFEVVRIGAGQSCLTFSIVGDGWEVVLRRPPRGQLASGAHDVCREFRVMSALHKDGRIPVARPLTLCEDLSVLGVPFYLMEKVDGIVIRDRLPDDFAGAIAKRRIGRELVDVLADIHSIDVDDVGLRDLGKPGAFLPRHLQRMAQLSETTRTREIRAQEAAREWLLDNCPAENAPCLVHGDYKLDNVILSRGARIAAVIDWEIATIADPLVDLGWLLYFWFDESSEFDMTLPVASVMTDPDFMRRRELLDLYAARRGIDPSDIRWYIVLAGWKISIIMESTYRRYLAGDADNENFATLDRDVVALAERALQFARDDLNVG